ncbi:MAG: sorbosone dehydrogenase family protein, partial [Pseudomonadota bacterium]
MPRAHPTRSAAPSPANSAAAAAPAAPAVSQGVVVAGGPVPKTHPRRSRIVGRVSNGVAVPVNPT